MSMYIDRKYLLLFSSRLPGFKQKSGALWNSKCLYCVDSEKNKKKLRVYIYEKANNLVYFCHNCNISRNIKNLLKDNDYHLYTEYCKESLFEKKTKEEKVIENPKPIKKIGYGVFDSLYSIDKLTKNHPARKYCDSRLIPDKFYSQFFYCPNFKEWTNEKIPGKFEEIIKDEGRIVIPLLDFDKTVIGYQGRSLDPNSQLRYISIMLNNSRPKLFGLDRVNINNDVYVLEGSLDAIYINNSVATQQGNLLSAIGPIPRDKAIMIPDKDVRNKEIIKSIDRLIKNNYRVCLLPHDFPGKDINAAICNGLTSVDVMRIIRKNTFSGLELQLEFNNWKKT